MGKFFGRIFGRPDDDYENEDYDDDMEREEEGDAGYEDLEDEDIEEDAAEYEDLEDEDIEEDAAEYGNPEDIEEDDAEYGDPEDESDAEYGDLADIDEEEAYGDLEDEEIEEEDDGEYRVSEVEEDEGDEEYWGSEGDEGEEDREYVDSEDEDIEEDEGDGEYWGSEDEEDREYMDSENEDMDEEEDDGEYGNSEDEDIEEDDDESANSEDEYEEDDVEDDEWDEDDRRIYRRRRRIRNQVIAYSVVFVFLAVLVAGGVAAGRNIAKIVKDKKQAAVQEQQQAEQEAQEAHEIVIDPPEEPIVEEEPEVDYLGGIVDACISSMPLEDKVAGLFVVTPEALTGVSTATQAGEGTQEALNTYAVGGLIYFDKNIKDKEQITEMLSSTISKSKYPIFLAVDEEGGSVSRVAKSRIDVIEVGDMASIGESGDTAQAYEAGLTIGTYLKELGFNVDFAPVADVAGSGDSALGDRVFGSDAKLVGDMVSNMVEGIEGAKVSACLKHFPGIGDSEGDTHDGRVETTKTLEEMRNSNFIPFQAGIDAGADFVMVSHVTASAVDEDAVPSTLSSKIMTDILRNELNFQGIIITDALNMGAITEYYTPEEAAIKAIEAGADMLLMPEDFESAYEALIEAVREGTIPEERINESLERIFRVKYADKLPEE